MAISLNWQANAANKIINPFELYSRVKVSGETMSAVREKTDIASTYAQDIGPQKASMKLLMNTLTDKLERVKKNNDQLGEIQPLLGAVRDTVNEIEKIYGQPVADMAIKLLRQEIDKNGASELALSGAFDKLLTTIADDQTLLEKNQQLNLNITGQEAEDGKWVGHGLLTLWNAGMNAVRDMNGRLENGNGEGEHWGGDNGLVLKNQTKPGIAHALAEFFKSNTEQGDDKQILRGTKIFAENGTGMQGSTTVTRKSVQWLESKTPTVLPEMTISDPDNRKVLEAIKAGALQEEIEKAAKFLLEDIGDEQAAHKLQTNSAHFIDTALQVLNTVKMNKGEKAARQVLNFFNNTFVEKINKTTVYDESIYKTYGNFFFTGFSDKVIEEVFDGDADKQKAPPATSPFYANWATTDESGKTLPVAYMGLGDNQYFFGKPAAIRGNPELKQQEQEWNQLVEQLQENQDDYAGGVKIIAAAPDEKHSDSQPDAETKLASQPEQAVRRQMFLRDYLSAAPKASASINIAV